MEVRSRCLYDSSSGWWWGVWQDGRLVGFRTSYRSCRKALSHEKACLRKARRSALPTVARTNSVVTLPKDWGSVVNER